MAVSRLRRFVCVTCGNKFEALCDARQGDRLMKCPSCGKTVKQTGGSLHGPVASINGFGIPGKAGRGHAGRRGTKIQSNGREYISENSRGGKRKWPGFAG